MFCFKCGRQLDEEFNFCPKCGADLSALKDSLKNEVEDLNESNDSLENTELLSSNYSTQARRPFTPIDLDFAEYDTNPAGGEYAKLKSMDVPFVDEIVLKDLSALTEEVKAQICQNKLGKLVIEFNGPYIKEDGSGNIFFNPLQDQITFKIEFGAKVTDASGLFFGCCCLKNVDNPVDLTGINKAEMILTCCHSIQDAPIQNISHIPEIANEIADIKKNLTLETLKPEICQILIDADLVKSFKFYNNAEYNQYAKEREQKDKIRRNPELSSENDITDQLLEDLVNGYVYSVTFKNSFFEVPENNPFYRIRDRLTEINFSINLKSEVKSLKNLFLGCSKLKKLPEFNVIHVTDFTAMCKDCTALEEIPELKLSSAENTTEMFMNCTGITKIPDLNLSYVKHADRMFMNCASLEEIPNFEIKNLQSFKDFLTGCSSLNTTVKYSYGVATETRKITFVDRYLVGL